MLGKGYNIQYCVTESTIIQGSKGNIGGIVGEMSSHAYGLVVNNSEIEGTTTEADNVGGIAGNNSQADHYYLQVQDTLIKSKGSNVGGIVRKYRRMEHLG